MLRETSVFNITRYNLVTSSCIMNKQYNLIEYSILHILAVSETPVWTNGGEASLFCKWAGQVNDTVVVRCH